MNIKKLTIMGVVVASFLALGAEAWAAEWRVPEDFPTIQAAIDSPTVMDGDRIIIGPGSYADALVTKSSFA